MLCCLAYPERESNPRPSLCKNAALPLSYPGKMHRAGVEPSHVLLIRQAPPTGWAPVHGSLGWTRTSSDFRRRINNPLPYPLGDEGMVTRAGLEPALRG